MPEAGRMKIAVVDDGGYVLVAWDDARIAKQIIEAAVTERVRTVTTGRWPLRRTRTVVEHPSVQEAVAAAMHDLSMEVARL